jgi:hypothetical protein
MLFIKKSFSSATDISGIHSDRPPSVCIHQLLLYLLIPLPPTPSTSSALKTPENIEEDPEDPEPADNGDIQMEYCADQLYSPSIGAVTKTYL